MWESVVIFLGLQAGGIILGYVVGYYYGRKHKLVGLMDRDEYVKQYEDI